MNIGRPLMHLTTSQTLPMWQELCLFPGRDVLVAAQRAKSATFAVALAIKPVARHAAVLPIVECNRALAIKSLPCLQRQGRCQMHQ